LNEILLGPAAMGELPESLSDFPTLAEQTLAVQHLLDSLPRLEALAIGLKTAIAAFEAEPAPPPAAPSASGETPYKLPSADAIRVYWLATLSGSSQAEVAEMYKANTGIPMTQGQVSRAIAEVKRWTDAGNTLPNIELPPARPQAVDPKKLDLGANQDGRTKRQRGKFDDE
jgi:hypothetical protein